MEIWNWSSAVAWRERRQNGGMWMIATLAMTLPVLGRILAVQLLQAARAGIGDMTGVIVTMKLVQSPSDYMGMWNAAAWLFAVAAWYREWSYQGLPVVLAGPVGRRHVASSKWWIGWFLLQGVLLFNVLSSVLMGAYAAGWQVCVDWWLSSAAGLSAVYAVSFLFAMWSGTARSAFFTPIFVVFGIHVWFRLLGTLALAVFSDWNRMASVAGTFSQWGTVLSVSQYLAQGAVFGNIGLKVFLSVVAALGLWLAVFSFDRLPLERIGRAWFFRWMETAALWVAAITLFMLAGSVGSTAYMHLGLGGHVPAISVRILSFVLIGGAAVSVMRAAALWAARRKYAQG